MLDFAGGEAWLGAQLWGYSFSAIAIGLIPLGLIAWERSRLGDGPRMFAAAVSCAVLVSWMQPWQGATLAGIVGATEVVMFLRSGRRWDGGLVLRLLTFLVAAALPLIYYFVLSKTDPAWELAGIANNFPRWPLWVLFLTLAPLAVPAAFAFGRSSWGDAGSIALRLWPVAALAVYFAPVGTFPFHAIQGIQIPLAVLAIIAVRERLGDRPIPKLAAVAAVVLLVVPGLVYRFDQMRMSVRTGAQPFFLTDSERGALGWLERNPQSGGVMTVPSLGPVVPAWTGRQTWLGAGSWSPDYPIRRDLLIGLFQGKLTPAQARQLVVRPGAGFLLADCRVRPGFEADVKAFTTVVWRDGCVAVLRVDGAPPLGRPQPPLPKRTDRRP
jgi:hypothetical protein